MENVKSSIFSIRNLPSFHDFYILHRSIKYPVNSLLISSISPVVSRVLVSNQRKNYFELPDLEGPISDFIDFIYGLDIRIDSSNCRFLNFVAKRMEIFVLENATADIIRETNTIENVSTFAEQLLSCGIEPEYEIQLLVSNFGSIIMNKFFSMCYPLLIDKVYKTENI